MVQKKMIGCILALLSAIRLGLMWPSHGPRVITMKELVHPKHHSHMTEEQLKEKVRVT